MILSVINNYSISKEEMDYVNLLVSKYPEIQELKDTIKSSSQTIINQLHEVYKKNNLDLTEFENEKTCILKVTNLFFCFRVLIAAVNKAGGQLKRLSQANNQVMKQKDNIIEENNERMKQLNKELEEMKKELSEKGKKQVESMQMKNKKIIDLKNQIVVTPINFGKTKANSVAEFTENLGLCFSDFNIEDGCINVDKSQIIVNGKYINEKKKEIGLNGRDAPRGIKDNDEIIIKNKK